MSQFALNEINKISEVLLRDDLSPTYLQYGPLFYLVTITQLT